MAELEISNLSFWHDKKHPLFTDFSLSVARGEIVGIVGQSGSGKSSLLDLVAGILKPKSGTIKSQKSSFIFQDPYSSFHPSYKIKTQIMDVIDSNTLDEEMLEDRLKLDRSLLDRYPHELSGGQLQRFSIFRAFSMQAGVMLADEPTSALDNMTQLEVMKLLVSLKDEFATLLVTHDMDLAKWACDFIINCPVSPRYSRLVS